MILVPLLLFVLIPTLLASICILSLLLYIALYRASTTTSRTSLGRSAAVVVLGDVGRSPRMCYHVESLADEGWRVAVVGYGGSSLPTSIQRSSVRFHKLKEVPSWIAKLPRAAFVAVAPLKLLWQSVGLFWKITMTIQPPPEVIFVQVSTGELGQQTVLRSSKSYLSPVDSPCLANAADHKDMFATAVIPSSDRLA